MKPKKRGFGIEMRIFHGTSGATYLVFKTRDGAFHTFREVEAKDAPVAPMRSSPREQLTQMVEQLLLIGFQF